MPRDIASLPGSEYSPTSALAALHPAGSKMKRALDVVGAAVGLVVLAPFLLLVAGVIWVESGGPVLFRQRRSGLNGAPFVIYKFRTMRADAEAPVSHAVRNDCRATSFGRWLRRTSLDEFPQLINVLKGEMSLV